MRNRETKAQTHTQEFIRATRELHDGGQDRPYLDEIRRQILDNRIASARTSVTRTVLGYAVKLHLVDIGETELTAARERLESEGRLESELEASCLQLDGHPQRRLIRLVEEPEAQIV